MIAAELIAVFYMLWHAIGPLATIIILDVWQRLSHLHIWRHHRQQFQHGSRGLQISPRKPVANLRGLA